MGRPAKRGGPVNPKDMGARKTAGLVRRLTWPKKLKELRASDGPGGGGPQRVTRLDPSWSMDKRRTEFCSILGDVLYIDFISPTVSTLKRLDGLADLATQAKVGPVSRKIRTIRNVMETRLSMEAGPVDMVSLLYEIPVYILDHWKIQMGPLLPQRTMLCDSEKGVKEKKT